MARVRHHSRGYTALVERNEAFAALERSRAVLANDIATAAGYVRSLLPPPRDLGGVRADWRFIPSASLGGDAFGYHDLDADHLAIYLLDVCGHGVGAALLSVSALTAIRSETLPQTDFRDPAAVLAALNKAFPMERHNDMFFTAWYGVFDRGQRRLRWAGGGHPPALLIQGGQSGGQADRRRLESEGPLIGAVEGLEFTADEAEVSPGSRLFVYSDGAFEISRPDGSMWAFDEFVEALAAGGAPAEGRMDALLRRVRELSGRSDFDDDFSIMELVLG